MKKTPDRVGPLAEAAAVALGVAAERMSPYAHTAADRFGPLAGQARDRVTPYAQQAAATVSPLAAAAIGAVTPLAQQAAERLTPLADSAKLRGGQAAQDAVERFGPVLEDALERVGPAVESVRDSVRDRVSEELIPKLTGALSAAAGAPIVTEAVSRGQATLAAARGDLTLPPPKKKRSWPKRVGIVAGVAAVAYVLARKLLGSKDSDWQAARPTTPYVPPAPASSNTGPASKASIFAADEAPTEAPTDPSEAGDDPQSGPSAHAEYLQANGEAEPDQPAEGGELEAEVDTVVTEPAVDTADTLAPVPSFDEAETLASSPAFGEAETLSPDPSFDKADTLATGPSLEEADTLVSEPAADSDPTILIEPDDTVVIAAVSDPVIDSTGAGVEGGAGSDAGSRYSGAGVYTGDEPPEGFVIKGNERSMKYHLPDSAGYVRTIAEVWFDSEEAARAAGFAPAQP